MDECLSDRPRLRIANMQAIMRPGNTGALVALQDVVVAAGVEMEFCELECVARELPWPGSTAVGDLRARRSLLSYGQRADGASDCGAYRALLR